MCIPGLKGSLAATFQGHVPQGHRQVYPLPATSLGAVLQGMAQTAPTTSSVFYIDGLQFVFFAPLSKTHLTLIAVA